MARSSFLPEDYVAQRTERRANLISLVLFVVIMTAVVGAFFVTNNQWARVKIDQQQINQRYAEAAQKIEQLNELESQKTELMERAEIVKALVERVPRSILLAEIINRMPESVSLEEFGMQSKKDRTRTPPKSSNNSKVKSLTKTKDQKTKAELEKERKVSVPRFTVEITLDGLAPSHEVVSQYLTNLLRCPLLRDVELTYSRQTIIEDQEMRKFRIVAKIDPIADVKQFEPLQRPRLNKHPMDDAHEVTGHSDPEIDVELEDGGL